MTVQSDEVSAAFPGVVWRLARPDAATLLVMADGLARTVRRRGAASADVDAPAAVTDACVRAALGGCDDDMRRAAVAAMAIALDRRPAEAWRPVDASTRQRLARRLARHGAYDRTAYATDAGFAAGLVLPVAPFRVVVPPPHQGEALSVRLRRAVATGSRMALTYGVGEADRWRRKSGLAAWAELHLDLRGCSVFHAQGFADAYRRLAAFLRSRPDLAGLRAASWLFDPELSHVSPELAFVRASAEVGDARFVRVRTDPVQTAFAAARSPARARLIATGAYRPACHAMTWLADDLFAWADRRAPGPADTDGWGASAARP
jgi:hypothetical protein